MSAIPSTDWYRRASRKRRKQEYRPVWATCQRAPSTAHVCHLLHGDDFYTHVALSASAADNWRWLISGHGAKLRMQNEIMK